MILIMGMPGAGKSVQSELLTERRGYHWLSTGKLFRKTQDPEIREVMNSGALVSDEMVCRMVAAELKEMHYDKTALLDGFPRTLPQAKWLLSHAEELNKHVRLILFLDVTPETSHDRLVVRGREDDNEEVIAMRHEEYKKILPLMEFLEEKQVTVAHVDANGTVEEVYANIERVLDVHAS